MFKKKASRFAVIYTQKIDGNNMKILLVMVTGVNYLYCRDGCSGGLTVMRNPDGSPIVTPPQMLFPNQTK